MMKYTDLLFLGAPLPEDVEEPKGLFEQFGQKEIKAIPDVKEAFEEALREKGDGILFCVGSLYLVGSIKKILRDKEDGK